MDCESDNTPYRTTEDIEIKLLLEAIYLTSGYDFRNYAQASIKRCIRRAAKKFDCSIMDLILKSLHTEGFLAALLPELTIQTTEMFRDPHVYKSLVEDVFPILRTYPSIKIWHAGCSTGEEVYSLAILLQEEGIYDQSLIYATDINREALQRAKDGIYSTERAREFTDNYHAAGRSQGFSRYYYADHGSIVMDRALQKNVVFAEHNLLTDSVFSEMHLILCRNVFIYFDRKTQAMVLNLFRDSLVYKGFLCLGCKEAILSKPENTFFQELRSRTRIYQAVGGV